MSVTRTQITVRSLMTDPDEFTLYDRLNEQIHSHRKFLLDSWDDMAEECRRRQVMIPDSPEPTTGGPYDSDYYYVPEGCTGYYKEDAEYGDILTHPRDGGPCPAHPPWRPSDDGA